LQRSTRPLGDLLEDEMVLAALQSLPTRQRAALTLRYLDECSVAEVADTLDVSYRAAESLLSRAKVNFRSAYGADDA
jgi:RNA polymerase sigma-70 factor (ECF subfamily)